MSKTFVTTNEKPTLCARCGRRLGTKMALARVGRSYLCWSCATPRAIATFWAHESHSGVPGESVTRHVR